MTVIARSIEARAPKPWHVGLSDEENEAYYVGIREAAKVAEELSRADTDQGAVETVKALRDRVRPDATDAREAAYGRGYQAAVADALEVLVRGR